MRKRKIAGREVSVIGLGAMAVDEYFPISPEEAAISLFRYAMNSGVTLFDTADVYGLNRNEALLGKAFTAEEKEKILIATKVGCTRPGCAGWGTDGRPEHIKKAIQGSLKRLGLSQIELYQLHSPDSKTPFSESITAMKELQQQGMIKHIGISNVSLEQLKEAQEIAEIASVQNHFNIFYKHDEADLLPYLTKKGIAFLPYFPLGSGKLLKDRRVVEIAQSLNVKPSQLALAWITTKWPTAVPIPGTSIKEHLGENLKAGEITLQKDIITKLDSIS